MTETETHTARLRRRQGGARRAACTASRARCAASSGWSTEDRYCIDVLTQIAAVNTALESLAFRILDDHVNHCVAGALASGDPVEADDEEQGAPRGRAPVRARALALAGQAEPERDQDDTGDRVEGASYRAGHEALEARDRDGVERQPHERHRAEEEAEREEDCERR